MTRTPRDAASTRDTPPTDHEMEDIVLDVLERLPDVFSDRPGSVAIVIEDEPTPAQLASVGAGGPARSHDRRGTDREPVHR